MVGIVLLSLYYHYHHYHYHYIIILLSLSLYYVLLSRQWLAPTRRYCISLWYISSSKPTVLKAF